MDRMLHDSDLASGEVASHFEITHSGISQHLQVLADAGLVTMRKDKTRRLYRARPEGLAELRATLTYLAACTSGRLESIQ